jgi:hypothetical protein
VPNAVDGGAPPFVCAGTTCIAACGQCTDNADCCPGTSCVLGAGATHGICGPCGAPPGGGGGSPDGGALGAPDGGGGGGGAPDGGGGAGPTCALYGQICTSASQCCNGVPCDGRCEINVPR